MRIIFHGYLKELCPEVYDFNVRTPLEALQALTSQIPSLSVVRDGQPYRCHIVGHDTVLELASETDVQELHVVPILNGDKSGGGFMQILIGGLAIAASFIPGVGQLLGGFLFSMGLSMVLGGLASMLAPSPKVDTGQGASNPAASQYLGSPKNTVALGTRIPVVYGRYQISGHFLSFDVNEVTLPATGGTSQGG